MNLSIFTALGFLISLVFLGSTLSGQDENSWMQQYNFVFLDENLSQAQFDVRYAGFNNFLGAKVNGYQSSRLVMTKPAAKALKNAEAKFRKLGYGLKIFDTYRPQRAVDHFKKWATDDQDTLTKSQFYPDQVKRQLFNLGYISSKSGHSRGSTIDLTLYDLNSGVEVDMGGPYDFFGEISHHSFTNITDQQFEMRQLLRTVLSECGFRAYSKEWWHYTLRGEPYPKTYFDYVVR